MSELQYDINVEVEKMLSGRADEIVYNDNVVINTRVCECCGLVSVIAPGHVDNTYVNSDGVLYMDECERCEDVEGNNYQYCDN